MTLASIVEFSVAHILDKCLSVKWELDIWMMFMVHFNIRFITKWFIFVKTYIPDSDIDQISWQD